ncbi:MAG: hypothetical protein JW909_08990 [Planctomycetes bacterium]|nr:hypothetical protein [Planctomycetota bacterium]
MNSPGLAVGPAEHCGNGLVLCVEDRDVPEVHFLAECRECTEFMWFHMDAAGAAPGGLRFVWDNAHYALGNSNLIGRMRPVYRIDDGEWERAATVRVQDKMEGPALVFETPPARVHTAVATCYPYGLRELDATLATLQRRPHHAPVALTSHGRVINRYRFPAVEHGGQAAPAGVYVLARQHSGETPGSLAMDGMMRWLANGNGGGMEWWLLPFVDLDGVESGNYGKDSLPIDFNRAWSRLPMRPEIKGIQSDMATFVSRTSTHILIDLHGPGHSEDGVYTHLPPDGRPEEQRAAGVRWAAHIDKRLVEMLGRGQETSFHEMNYPSRWNKNDTATAWAWDYLKLPGFGTEVSYQSYGGIVLDIPGYHKVGEALAAAACDFIMEAGTVE